MALTKAEIHGLAAEVDALVIWYETNEIENWFINSRLEERARNISAGNISEQFDSKVYLAITAQMFNRLENLETPTALSIVLFFVSLFSLGWLQNKFNYIDGNLYILIAAIAVCLLPAFFINRSYKKKRDILVKSATDRMNRVNNFFILKSNGFRQKPDIGMEGNVIHTASFSVPSQDD